MDYIRSLLTKLHEKRYNQLRLFNTVPSNPEEGDVIEMPLELLVMSENSLRNSFYSVIDGNPSMTDGAIDVWFTDEGIYALTDGYHRVAEAMLVGKEYLDAKVEGVGYSTYWRTPPEGERFEYKPNKEFKGLELFAEESILRDKREEFRGN